MTDPDERPYHPDANIIVRAADWVALERERDEALEEVERLTGLIQAEIVRYWEICLPGMAKSLETRLLCAKKEQASG